MDAKPSSDEQELFVIIGAGAAGNTAAETLRKEGFKGRLVMMTRESCLPYDRTELSKKYLRVEGIAPPVLRSEKFYKDNNIEVLTKCEATDVNVNNKTISCNDGTFLNFDKLLIASGSSSRCLSIPGFQLKNVFTLRDLDDADKIKKVAQKGTRAVIIGASFIALEVAATLREMDISVTVVAPELVPFEQILGEKIGKMFQEVHEENGVSFRLGRVPVSFEGKDKVQRVTLKNGEVLDADFVLMGIGTQPITGFIKGVDLNPDGSVTADKYLQINKDVYAAGDIVRFVDWRTGELIRTGHWRLASEHGRIAAYNMLGKSEEFRSIPFFWTKQFGVDLRYVGHINKWDEIIFHGDPAKRDFSAYYVKNGRVLAAAGVGSGFKMSAIARLMDMGKMPTPDELRKGPVDMDKILKDATDAPKGG